MDVALCTDNNYVMPCGITMISVMENNKDIPITFHIVGVDLNKKSKEQILTLGTKYKNVSILFYEIKKELFDSYNIAVIGSKYLSITAYTRLFLLDILPSNIDKILYLDCDVIVLKNLSELWNINFENYSVVGAIDLFLIGNPETFQRLEYDESFGYINSGVLLMNLKYWREHNIIETFLSFYKEKYDRVPYCDQDIINGTLYNSKLLFPIKYNVLDSYYLSKRIKLFEYEDEIQKAIEDPIIIHYTGRYKPWLKTCTHPLKNEFLKYKNISPWKDIPLSWGKKPFSEKLEHYKRLVLYNGLRLKKPKYIKAVKGQNTRKFNIK